VKPEVEAYLTPLSESRTKLFHWLLYSVWVTIFLYCFLFAYFEVRLGLYVELFGTLVLSPLAFILERRGFVNWSRLLFIASCNFYIYGSDLAMGFRASVDYYYIPAMIIPVLILDNRRKLFMIPALGLSLVCWGASLLFGATWVPPELVARDVPVELIQEINFLGAIGITLVFVKIFLETSGQLKDLLVAQAQREVESLKELSARMEEAQAIARVGSFRFELRTQELHWSKELYNIFDVDPSVSGSELYETYISRVHPDDLDHLNATVAESLASGEGYNLQHRIVTRSGQVRHMNCSGIINKDDKGAIVSISGTAQDVTISVARENRLKSLIDFNAVILASTKFAIITTDVDFTITGINEEAERILGYSVLEIVGRASPLLLHDPNELRDAAKALSREVGRSVQPDTELFKVLAAELPRSEREWTFIGKAGTRTPVRLTVCELRDKAGGLYGYMGIARDMTEEIAMQAELEHQRAQALHSAKLASLGEMSAGIAHEINNPLTVMVGAVDLLIQHEKPREAQLLMLNKIKAAGGRIIRIVRALRTFARQGEHDPKGPVSLLTLVEGTLDFCSQRFAVEGIELDVRVAPELRLFCRELEISQVLVNLLNNAFDATLLVRGKKVTLDATVAGDKVEIRVTNSGEIPPEVCERLFQPFFTTKEVGKGTGLGLNISRRIAQEHGGTLSFTQGSGQVCFKLTLPLA